ncbi:MAG: hypothetical protein OXJ53_18625 [Gammaproteobacteria bacterium]|nr:hypothetical protein [Gammaproteobacteria bacterium]
MIDPVSFLAFTLVWVGLSHAVCAYRALNRLIWACLPGAVLLLAVHPLALLFALTSFAFSFGLYCVGRAGSSHLRARLPYLVLLLLFVPDLTGIWAAHPILWLGSAFFVIRQMMTVAAGLKERRRPSDFVPSLLLATFFFAALPSGPVFNGLRVWDALHAESKPSYADGLYRLFEGFAYLFALAGLASVAIEQADAAGAALAAEGETAARWMLRILIDPLLGFAFVFTTFYGYSRMAEGTALLFGFEVPQNFNRPHLATDLADFWKRWHRSMADFVMQHIYLPLLVSTKRARLALITAFVFMGMWHQFTLGFLIWGLGHGLCLAVLLPWAHRRRIPAAAIRVASLAYVVALSAIAQGVWT